MTSSGNRWYTLSILPRYLIYQVQKIHILEPSRITQKNSPISDKKSFGKKRNIKKVSAGKVLMVVKSLSQQPNFYGWIKTYVLLFLYAFNKFRKFMWGMFFSAVLPTNSRLFQTDGPKIQYWEMKTFLALFGKAKKSLYLLKNCK